MVSEAFGEFGHMMYEESMYGTLGLSILEKGRLRVAVGGCGTSLMRGSEEKTLPRGAQGAHATTENSYGYMRKNPNNL